MLMALSLGVTGVCFADAGKVLSQEEKACNTFIDVLQGEQEHPAVEKLMSPGLKAKLGTSQFAVLKKSVADKFGKVTQERLVALEKLGRADKVVYMAKATKADFAQFIFVFDVSGKKPMLEGINMVPVTMKKEATKK